MEHKGTVYFFTGLSGAGKTTVGSLFYRRLKNTKPNAVYLDGDEIRVAFGEDVGYTNDERLRWAGRDLPGVQAPLRPGHRRGVLLHRHVSDAVRRLEPGAISPITRRSISGSKPETLHGPRNQKGLYTGGRNVVGVDLPFDEPQTPDLDASRTTENAPLWRRWRRSSGSCIPNIVENPIDNRDYWNRYYQDGLCPMDPSPFARYAATLVEPGRTLVDLGCGNGRDALYFASLGLSVIAIDLSDTAIQTLRERGGDNPRFLCGDFINAPIHRPASYDYAYSRFTIHAINQQQERMLLLAMHRAIKPGGKFFIEVRGVHDPLYGRGQPQEKNAFFYNNHYRRFIVMEELTASLQEAGFRVEYAQERTGFAPYGNDDPPVIRIVAIRKEMKA